MNDYTSNNLYAAEEWDVIFNAYNNISIKAFDYDTVMEAMTNYLKTNNPEEFDMIMKNGVMTIHLDLIARLTHNLSYRYEQSARENFFDTATIRENVMKLAKAFSYKPKRNRAANGLCKVSAVRTSEPIKDAEGNDISSQFVRWNQVGDPEWQDKFIRVMNAAFTDTNSFGKPVKREYSQNVLYELYGIDRVKNGSVAHTFSANVNNARVSLELVSSRIDDGSIVEDTPDPNASFNIFYKNDRGGNFSPNTGFFAQFKEGTLRFQNLLINEPEENRTYNVDYENINETDVWFMELDDDGNIQHVWDEVNSLYSQSVEYENIFNMNRKLYTVESQDDNKVSLHFGDGTDTEIPKGRYRLWFRTSKNERFIIKSKEIFEVPVQVSYVGKDGQRYQLTMLLTNLDTISNSEPEESVDRIKRNSPLAHYAQDRMINAEDYNIYPQTQTSLIKKQKTVNRTHAGHSRYLDIYNTYDEISHVVLNADDGYVYFDEKERLETLDILPNTNVPNEVTDILQNIIDNPLINNNAYYNTITKPLTVNDVCWRTLPNDGVGKNGYLENNGIMVEVGLGSPITNLQPIQEQTILVFEKDGYTFTTFVVEIQNNGIVNPAIDLLGNVRLNDEVPDDYELVRIIPTIKKEPSSDDISLLIGNITNKRNFTLYYNFMNNHFEDTNDTLSMKIADFVFIADPDSFGERGVYDITHYDMWWVLGSGNDIRFYHKDYFNLLDPETLLVFRDYLIVEDGNSSPNSIKDTFIKKRNDIDVKYF